LLVYEPIYMAIYVYSLVCKHMHVVIGKRRLIWMHMYVVTYVWQGSITCVHNYVVTPSVLISQVCKWVVYESMCSHNSRHVCFEVHKSAYVRAYVYEYWYFEMITNVLGLGWLQLKTKWWIVDILWEANLCETSPICLGSKS